MASRSPYLDKELDKIHKKLQREHRELLISHDHLRAKASQLQAELTKIQKVVKGDLIAIDRKLYEQIKDISLKIAGFKLGGEQ